MVIMSLQDQELMSTLFYYLRERYSHHVQMIAESALKRFPNDSMLKLYLALVAVAEGKFQDAIRRFTELKDKEDYTLAALISLAQTHKKCSDIDQDTVKGYEVKIRELRRQANGMALYLAAMVLFHFQRYEKAREYVERSLKANLLFVEALNLNGWIDLTVNDEQVQKKAIRYFEGCVNDDERMNVDTQMGKARYFQWSRAYMSAMDVVNIVIVNFPKYIPALIEKMRLQLTLKDWDQAIDVAQRCLAMDSNCIEAFKCQLLHSLCQTGKMAEARQKLTDLGRALSTSEPDNANQYYRISTYFSLLCGRDPVILQQLVQFAERATVLDSRNQKYAVTLGRILLLQGRTKEAIKQFQTTLEFSETSVVGLQGIVQCQLAQGSLKEASTQLEFLKELQHTTGKNAELAYMTALLGRKQSMSSVKILGDLDEATDLHFYNLEKIHPGTEYYEALNPDFLVQLVNEYLTLTPQQPPITGVFSYPSIGTRRPDDSVLTRCLRILEPLTNAMPGFQRAVYLLAYVQFLMGDMSTALSTVKTCLELDTTFIEGHILSAQIYLHQDNLKLAEQALETGLSNNFEVRTHPLYQLVRAQLLIKQGSSTSAVQILKQTIASLNNSSGSIGTRPTLRSGAENARVTKNITLSDRLTFALALAEAHRNLGEFHEATKVLQDAQLSFAGSPEVGRITIASADLALSQGDHEMALNTLRGIRQEHPYYLTARQQMANIYLHHRKEKKLYVACYRELAETIGTAEANLLLGDAYMTIQEPDRAMEVYEAVLRKHPNDLRLASKMGKALVRTHNYSKAVSYYEAAVKGGQITLRLDLTDLLIKLKQYEKAKRLLMPMATENNNDPVTFEFTEVRRLINQLIELCALEPTKTTEHIQLMTRTKEVQARKLTRAQTSEANNVVAEQRLIMADICLQLATLHTREYQQMICERGLAVKEKAKFKDESCLRGGILDSAGETTLSAAQHMSAAVTLCQEAIGHMAMIAGKNELDPRRPSTLSLIRPIGEGDLGRIRRAAVQTEARALFQLGSLYLTAMDYVNCEQETLKLAQLQEEIDVYEQTNLSDYIEPTKKIAPEDFSSIDPAHNPCSPKKQAEQQSHQVLLLSPAHSSSLLMAELSHIKGDFESTAKHLENAVSKYPTDYHIMSRLVDAMRRAGKLPRALELLNKSRALDPQGNNSTGFNYCLGLCYWANGENALALQHLNRARVDGNFAEDAVYRMVEICLSPQMGQISASGEMSDQIMLANQFNTSVVNSSAHSSSLVAGKNAGKVAACEEAQKRSFNGIETAEKLLKDLRVIKSKKRHRFLTNMILLATGSKTKVETALETFAQMTQKEEAEELEKAWLLLVDLYIQGGKMDLAHELLKRCLQYNKSCAKAYECVGFIMEKDQNFLEAARNYELAWVHSNKQNPAVGYKLAYNYLKVRQLIEAIEVCLQVSAYNLSELSENPKGNFGKSSIQSQNLISQKPGYDSSDSLIITVRLRD
ncbi:tetratricopeptide repeat protein 21B [Paragonimus westermani]|uniref:Tetratricopeptide repeat protein 21B n=1 Tax=Paragonimus westermani TaxID=34504 RepID=A0A5J4NQ15_9TREM|nr:tetratricopeptide repeat protein 21B [Paragonimus westermani]